jgi:hypothetical protein
MVYLTHYCEYPIYEPAEGGYYYSGREAYEYYRLNSVKQAKRKLAKMKAELEAEGFIVDEDRADLYSKYIGEGESWRIEKVYGSRNSGKQIYQ